MPWRYKQVVVMFLEFLTSALVGEWSDSRLGHFNSREGFPIQNKRILVVSGIENPSFST
jgi:hypothetical protein